MAKRIGLLTGGGDAPGENVCLKALVYSATDRGYDVIGIRKGWEGLLHYDLENTMTHGDQVMPLTKQRVHDIDRLPGSFLHTSRIDPGAVPAEAVPAFLSDRVKGNGKFDLTEHVKGVIDKLQLDALIVLGDRTTLVYAARLSGEGVPVLGIPKTVHNNVSGSDYALGFSTALGRGVRLINEIRAMAGTREEIAVVEILGRNTGLTTMLIAFLAGADRALIPEVPYDPEKLAALLVRDQRANPNNYAILTMSEATAVQADKAPEYLPEISRLANSRTLDQALETGGREELRAQLLTDLPRRREVGVNVIGTGAIVTEILENVTGQRVLFQPLSYLLRTGEPDGQDLLGAMNFATLAIRLLVEGKMGRMVAYRQRENYVDLPIEQVNQAPTNIRVADYYDAEEYAVRSEIFWATRV